MNDRRIRWRITYEGVGALGGMGILIAAALIRNENLLLIIAGVIASMLIGNWWIARRSAKRIRVARLFSRSFHAGETLVVELQVSNVGRWGSVWAVRVEDRVARVSSETTRATLRPSVVAPHLAAHSTHMLSYRVRMDRRGRYRLGPLLATCRFPFGFIEASLRVNDERELTVFSRLGRISRSWRVFDREGSPQRSARVRKPLALEGEFNGLREYRRGDSRRWIHWKTSARRGDLMVRQFEREQHRDLWVLVDLYRPEKPTPEHDEAVERALSLAATLLVQAATRRGGSVVFLLGSAKPVTLHGGLGPRLLHESLTELAHAEGTRNDPTPQLAEDAMALWRAGSETLLITTRPPEAVPERRFAKLSADHRSRGLLSGMQTVSMLDERTKGLFDVQTAGLALGEVVSSAANGKPAESNGVIGSTPNLETPLESAT